MIDRHITPSLILFVLFLGKKKKKKGKNGNPILGIVKQNKYIFSQKNNHLPQDKQYYYKTNTYYNKDCTRNRTSELNKLNYSRWLFLLTTVEALESDHLGNLRKRL